MHPKGTNPESARLAEQFKKPLTPEQIQHIKTAYNELKPLWESLTSLKKDSIKSIYGRLIDEQKSVRPNFVLVDQLKNELLGEFMTYYPRLKESLNAEFPDEIRKYMGEHNLKIQNIAEQCLQDITQLMKEPLTSDVEKNPFRLSVWMDKIRSTMRVLENIGKVQIKD